MKNYFKSQKGFIQIPLLIIVIISIIVASVGTGVVLHQQGKLTPPVANIAEVFKGTEESTTGEEKKIEPEEPRMEQDQELEKAKLETEKAKAEAEKFKAEAEKLKAETEKLKTEQELQYQQPQVESKPEPESAPPSEKTETLPVCTNECSYSGQWQCSGNNLQLCSNYDSDECLEWGNYQYCQYGCSSEKCKPAPPQYEVQTSITDYNYAPAIQVTVSGGGEKSLDLILSGPNRSTVDTEYISRNEMLDGSETVWIRLTKNVQSTASPGIYTLIIKELFGEEIFRQEFSIKGAKLTVVNCDLTFHSPYPGPYGVDKIVLTMKNEGDISVYVYPEDTYIFVDSKTLYPRYDYTPIKILPGETKTMTNEYVGSFSAGTHTLEVRITGDVDGKSTILTTYTTTVTNP